MRQRFKYQTCEIGLVFYDRSLFLQKRPSAQDSIKKPPHIAARGYTPAVDLVKKSHPLTRAD